jgi:hypothetical protein
VSFCVFSVAGAYVHLPGRDAGLSALQGWNKAPTGMRRLLAILTSTFPVYPVRILFLLFSSSCFSW